MSLRCIPSFSCAALRRVCQLLSCSLLPPIAFVGMLGAAASRRTGGRRNRSGRPASAEAHSTETPRREEESARQRQPTLRAAIIGSARRIRQSGLRVTPRWHSGSCCSGPGRRLIRLRQSGCDPARSLSAARIVRPKSNPIPTIHSTRDETRVEWEDAGKAQQRSSSEAARRSQHTCGTGHDEATGEVHGEPQRTRNTKGDDTTASAQLLRL